MQYFRPGEGLFVGDCMPFFHGGLFRLYCLLDEGHHRGLGGLGGHQWAQASSRDLVHWEHHPLAIPITNEREGSICTGSVFFHEGLYYAFYATRMRDRTEHLSLALSYDGVRFEKAEPNPFASPPVGYSPYHYRDPFVFKGRHDGLFHMLVTAWLEDPPIPGRGGCLAHLVSTDLRHWQSRDPFLVPGLPGAPECPDYFFWNGWWYLVFSSGGVARFRTSRRPDGPWLRPKIDTLDGPAARVMKTAPFTDGRRIGVAWIGTRERDRDDGRLKYAGNAVFRELVQHDDGSLGARFPKEMVPSGRQLSTLRLRALGEDVRVEGGRIHIVARQGLGAAVCSGVPLDAHLRIRLLPQPDAVGFGLRLRATDTFESGYDLHLAPQDRVARLNDQWLLGVDGLDHPFDLDVVLQDDIIDVCIDERRTLIDRCPERRGEQLFMYAQDSDVAFEVLEIAALP
jgi:hypothetical protein